MLFSLSYRYLFTAFNTSRPDRVLEENNIVNNNWKQKLNHIKLLSLKLILFYKIVSIDNTKKTSDGK